MRATLLPPLTSASLRTMELVTGLSRTMMASLGASSLLASTVCCFWVLDLRGFLLPGVLGAGADSAAVTSAAGETAAAVSAVSAAAARLTTDLTLL